MQERKTKENIRCLIIEPVSCSERLAGRKSDKRDPNREFNIESPKKYVNATDPEFWISLHAQNFDMMRWNHIYKNGNYYETGITEQFKEILHSRDKKGLVIDVGMNIGWFSVYSRAMGHDVVAFDPNPIMHTRVCESLKLNDWMDDNSVKTFAHGLGEEPASLNITTGKNPGGSSFLEDRLAKRFRKKLEVSVVRLDDVAEQEGWIINEEPIYLWKMDVEGYEYHVFRGATKLLQSGKVENIVLENSNKDLRQVIDMYAAIYSAGYEIHLISDVQAKPYHVEMIPGMNKEFQGISPGADESQAGENIIFLSTVAACNIWWKKRE
jgi:FkbM family methyltransferase